FLPIPLWLLVQIRALTCKDRNITSKISAAMTTAAPEAVVEEQETDKERGGGVLRYVLIRFLLIFPTIFILVTTVFFLMRSTGDPITAALGGRLSAEDLERRIAEAGYDRPLLIQYFEYL